jgi:hypothetical protein
VAALKVAKVTIVVVMADRKRRVARLIVLWLARLVLVVHNLRMELLLLEAAVAGLVAVQGQLLVVVALDILVVVSRMQLWKMAYRTTGGELLLPILVIKPRSH